MLPKRVMIQFDNAVLEGKNYIAHAVIIDDPLTISIIIEYIKRNEVIDEFGSPSLPPELSIPLLDSLRDRYVIPDYFDDLNYYMYRRKEMI